MQFQSQSNYPPQNSSTTTHPFSPEGVRALEDAAQRHGFSFDAVATLVDALNRSNGSQAQFNHWEFGGMGQWSQGGMIMIGDMFNNSLKYRVSNLCVDLSNLLRSQQLYKAPEPVPAGSTPANGWPAEFGYPSTSGSQNNMSYAYFPSASRLCVRQDGHLRIFDTGRHQISGVSQQQGGGQSLNFTSQFGLVRTLDLPEIMPWNAQPQNPPPAPPQPAAQYVQPTFSEPAQPVSSPNGSPKPDVVQLIQHLAELHKIGVLTNEEFASKKAELLGRI